MELLGRDNSIYSYFVTFVEAYNKDNKLKSILSVVIKEILINSPMVMLKYHNEYNNDFLALKNNFLYLLHDFDSQLKEYKISASTVTYDENDVVEAYSETEAENLAKEAFWDITSDSYWVELVEN